MKKFFNSKFFAIIVVVALIMVIVPSVFYGMGLGGTLKNGINTVLTPFQKLFNYVADAAEGFTSYFTEFDRISEENEELKKENADLRDRISSAEEAEEMNKWLYDYLELRREHTDYKMQDATVTGRESGNYKTVFILDKGTLHGIEVNMPVITSEGIVGHIAEVGADWSKAVTVLQSGSSVGAYVERSGELGVIEGDYTLSKDGLCKLSYMAEDADIKVGDRIVSSGYGSVYPRGLIIGYVEAIEKNAENRALDVTVRPTAEMGDNTKRLMILTDYDAYAEPEKE